MTELVLLAVFVKKKVNPHWVEAVIVGKVIDTFVAPDEVIIICCSKGNVRVEAVPEIVLTSFKYCVDLCVIRVVYFCSKGYVVTPLIVFVADAVENPILPPAVKLSNNECADAVAFDLINRVFNTRPVGIVTPVEAI